MRSSRPMRAAGAGLALMVVLGACSATTEQAEQADGTGVAPGPGAAAAVEPSGASDVRPAVVGDLVTGLESPWSVLPLDPQTVLLSERDTGRILKLDPNTGQTREVARITDLSTTAESGLMGLAVSPVGDRIFAMYTAPDGNRVVSMAWDGETLGPEQSVISKIPRADFHDGGRLAVGPDGYLYISTGDATNPDNAQDLDTTAGKILRLTLDGEIPAENPFPDSPVYSWGHRNVQGLAFDDEGRLWASEFGSSDFDELNLIEPGGNYGWPVHEGPSDDPDYISPKAWWSPTSIASPSGIAIAEGSVWVASLRGQTLWQVPIADGQAGQPIARFENQYGRLRDVVVGTGGQIWLLTNNTDGRGEPRPGDDRVLRVELEQP